MRLNLIIAIFCLAILALSGWLYQRVANPTGWGDAPPGMTTEATIQAAQHRFEQSHTPALTIDLEMMFAAPGRRDLVDPSYALPFVQQLPLAPMQALYQYATTCDQGSDEKLQLATRALAAPLSEPAGKKSRVKMGEHAAEQVKALKKARQWTAFLCDGTELPPTFFAIPPFVHPSGASYVRLAAESGRLAFAGPEWLLAHVDGLHVLELRLFPPVLARLSPAMQALADFDREALATMLRAQPQVVTTRSILFLEARTGESFTGGVYRVYDLSSWSASNANANLLPLPFPLPLLNYELARRASVKACIGSGTYCWAPVPNHRQTLLNVFMAFGTAAFLGLIVTLAVMFTSRQRSERRERQHQLTMLRTLTHELRTPATGLALELEAMRPEFDQLPDSVQQAFLRLGDQVSRLSRVITGSTRYLRSHTGSNRKSAEGRTERQTLASINSFVSAVVNEIIDSRSNQAGGPRVDVRLLAKDQPFSTDPYWLRMALANLLDNACKHGGAKIAVDLAMRGQVLEIQVQDDGKLSGVTLASLVDRFGQRRNEHESAMGSGPTLGVGVGLGLGLSIVRQVAKDMGGSLILGLGPTTFVLRVRELKS